MQNTKNEASTAILKFRSIINSLVFLYLGWSLGEHQEWSKYSNFEVSVNAPLMFYIPGVTAPRRHRSKMFPFINPLHNLDQEKKFTASKKGRSKVFPDMNTLHSLNQAKIETAPKEDRSKILSYTSPLHNFDQMKKYDEYKHISPFALRMVKTLQSFDHSEGKRVRKEQISTVSLSRNGYNPKFMKYNITTKFAELVDIFPTLSDLAGLPKIPLCPVNSSLIKLCTEGTSLLPVIFRNTFNQSDSFKWKSATFSQYPRPSDFPTEYSDQPNLKNIKIVGYSMRTKNSRYTEWISFDPVLFRANWSEIHARELYLYDLDPLEMHNVAGLKKYSELIELLSQKLKNGWRGALS